jgi:hypothetical protein
MSIGSGAQQSPAPPPLEYLLWRVRKGTRIAEARLRLMAHGEALGIESAGTLEDLLAHGWQHEHEPTEKGELV